jgi:hypothetical protein
MAKANEKGTEMTIQTGFPIQSNPIQSNPAESNPMNESNPTQPNPTQPNRIQLCTLYYIKPLFQTKSKLRKLKFENRSMYLGWMDGWMDGWILYCGLVVLWSCGIVERRGRLS